MPDSDQVIDEHTLAAFIAGTLPKNRRDEVITYLAGNSDAREVLQMAYDALETAQDSTLYAEGPSSPAKQRTGTPPRRGDRASGTSDFLRGAGRYVAATMIVFAIGIVLRLAFGPPTDALRSPLSRESEILRVQVDAAAGPSFTWSAVENAYLYRIVVWDPSAARVVGQYETRDSDLGAGNPIVDDLATKLGSGDPYTLRIDAIDAQNRLIRSSETVEFVAP